MGSDEPADTHHPDMTVLSILLHTRASGGGGAERVFALLAEALAARGHTVVFAVDALEPGYAAPAGVRVVELGSSHGRGVLRLARLLRRGRFDVAAAAVSVSNVKLAAASVLSRRRTPLVVSYHGFEEWRTGRLSALGYKGLPWLSRHARRVVCVSDGLLAVMVRDWGADPRRTVRIYNPVAFPPSPVTAAALAARPPVAAAVGRLSPEKGMADLVAAFAKVKTPGAKLVIGGEGPERGRIEAAVTEQGLDGRVVLLGQVAGSSEIFGSARVAVVPSRSEAFGLAVVEALGAGLPVVATDCGGPAEILDRGRFGSLVPVGDAAGLAEAIDAALSNPGDPAPRQARAETFSLTAGVDAWERLFRDVASPPPVRR